MCWRDDDEWEEPFIPLNDMIQKELGVKRFIDPDVLEDTILKNVAKTAQRSDSLIQVAMDETIERPNFCSQCGQRLGIEGGFCHNCGAQIKNA
jgi:hypothetical protein